ncbi:MAG: iron-sulfur cluster assembly scaffold protein [Deltaproteobacteria bacterium]|nr:iron-sulfur cluster assembly scaffold protein [Deltaproteobacteria bacterium]
MYSPTTLDYFMHPRNVGRVDEYDGVGRARSRFCDDRLEITVAVRAGAVRAGFRAQACSACIAAASMLTDLVNARPHSPAEARAIDLPTLAAAMVAVPEEKLRCVRLAPVALARALDDAAKEGAA